MPPRKPSPVLGAAMALIGDSAASLTRRDSRFRHSFEVALDAVTADPQQPRRHFDAAALRALADTMANQGQLQPVLVRRDPDADRRWVLIAGERRWRAAQLLGWPTLLALEHDGDPETTALVENLQRVDLSPPETARALERLIAGKGWSQARAGEVLGMSKAEVSATLRILTLPEALLDQLLTSELDLPRNVLVELARVEPGPVRDRLLAMARAGTLTVKAVRQGRAAVEVPSAPVPSRAGLPRRAVSHLARQLGTVREQGRALTAGDRAALTHLKAEIDALLADAAA